MVHDMKKINKNYSIGWNRNLELQQNFEKLTPEEKFRSEVERMKVFSFTNSCRKLIKITVPAERKVTVNGSLFLFIFQFSDIMYDRSDWGSTDHAKTGLWRISESLTEA